MKKNLTLFLSVSIDNLSILYNTYQYQYVKREMCRVSAPMDNLHALFAEAELLTRGTSTGSPKGGQRPHLSTMSMIYVTFDHDLKCRLGTATKRSIK
jgi:hypothetical protein